MGSIPQLRAGVLGVAVALVLAGTTVSSATAAGINVEAASPTVTLLTGDKVVLLSPDGARLSVIPGPGRRSVSFATERARGHLYVIPTDAARLVATGTLDRQLFDVTELAESGYGDDQRDDLPVIVSYRGARPATAGLRSVRELPAVRGAAMRVAKTSAGTFWNTLVGKGVPGLSRVWLDRKRTVQLDQSVPQIGAPAAWQAGVTGTGVKVAVLDTGVDATHPSLAGQVVASRNFTDGPGGDGFGHGTHVASTIAGTDSRYRGVAYGAQIVDGKVCDNSGSCPDSALIAGMHWAVVEQGARVVNLSLSGEDTPEIDQLEQAVNELTAQTGALFVAAAGNRPRCTNGEHVNSPATADAALAVGAIDRQEQLAVFSCRGPRTGDLGLKPDVTAPGVDIVAAQAAGTELGPVVAPGWVRASGTSMATPHAAGAAALLAQQHPTWKAAELKAALMASARPSPALKPYDQGAGRIDVAAAITQTIVAEPGGLSFGKQAWPHTDDEPVSRQVTYRNLGLTEALVTLEPSLLGPDGLPAPEGALTLNASSLTIPAGGSATVTVTSNTRHTGPTGLYTGQVLARSGTQTATFPLVVDLEPESYDLTLKAIDRKGALTDNWQTILYSPDDDLTWTRPYDPSGVAKVRVPKGRYHLEAYVNTPRPDGDYDIALLVQPLIDVSGDTQVELDARLAKPVKITLPRKDLEAAIIDIGYLRKRANGEHVSGLLTWTLHDVFTAHLGPAVPDDQFISRTTGQWAVPGPKGDFANTPYVYALNWFGHGRFVTGFEKVVEDSQLARVTSHQSSTVASRVGLKYLFGTAVGSFAGGASPGIPYHLPAKAVQYVQPMGVVWGASLQEVEYDASGAPETMVELRAPDQSFLAGQRVTESWNQAVFGPSFPVGGKNPAAGRSGDTIVVDVPLFTDRGGHLGASRLDSGQTVLYRNGVEVATSPDPGFIAASVPAAIATYRLETTADRTTVADVTSRQTVAWTFRSGHTEDQVVLPVAVARFAPEVDARNRASSRPAWVPMSLLRPDGSAFGEVRRPSVQVSYDDGTTWSPAPVRPTRSGAFELWTAARPGAKFVSLRVSATDRSGNRLDQTVVRAYGLR